MDSSRDGDGRAESPAAPRVPARQGGTQFACYSSATVADGQYPPAPFDGEVSRALDVQQAALDEIAAGFGHLGAAYQISPANRYLPKALVATVEAFRVTVGAIRELECEARL